MGLGRPGLRREVGPRQRRQYAKRADAGQYLKELLQRKITSLDGSSSRTLQVGQFAGFPLLARVDRSGGKHAVGVALDGAPGVSISFPARELAGTDPAGLVTRLERRLVGLEDRKAAVLADIDHARGEITHATDGLGKPFPQATELQAAEQRCRDIDRQLDDMAAPAQETALGQQPAARPAGGRCTAARDEPAGASPGPAL